MKFASVLALLACVVVVVSAAPCNDRDHHHGGHGGSRNENHEHNENHEINSNYEDKSNTEVKNIHQGLGDVGTTHNGLLGGLLGGGILSETTNNYQVSQDAHNH